MRATRSFERDIVAEEGQATVYQIVPQSEQYEGRHIHYCVHSVILETSELKRYNRR